MANDASQTFYGIVAIDFFSLYSHISSSWVSGEFEERGMTVMQY